MTAKSVLKRPQGLRPRARALLAPFVMLLNLPKPLKKASSGSLALKISNLRN